eukprot:TRINITY_DN15578_c0_g3_i1.p1 TRINITY_DN15578_c0_g3~~TRINITY_DN15578_c0_g3_i1.p1  ORF type:complete len:152 (+),score=53.02 TRINITY_DN15578_c0_g3_i1:3-458(+)
MKKTQNSSKLHVSAETHVKAKPRDSVIKEEEPYSFAKELFKIFAPKGKSYIEVSEIKRLLEVFKSSIPPLMAARILSEIDGNGEEAMDFKGSLGREVEFEKLVGEEPEHSEREKEDVLRAFKFIAEDPMYITKKKIDEIVSDKRYVPEVSS